jgi:glycine/D-amino acid oxidase-like deaminating enzyme
VESDVIIVGAGIVGAACARALALAGFSVLVLDRGTTAGGTSSACEGNLLVSDKGPGHELVLAQFASRLWTTTAADLRAELGDAFPSLEFDRMGGLVVATTVDGAESLLAFADAQRGAGVDARVLDAVELLELEPDLNPAVTSGVFYPDDAQVQPTIATEALMASARKHGARLLENTEVTGGLFDDGGALTGGPATSPAGSDSPSRFVPAAANCS